MWNRWDLMLLTCLALTQLPMEGVEGKSTGQIIKSVQRDMKKREKATDLPGLPSSHSPDSPQWTNSLAVCAIMRDENVTDVIEWLQYYKWLGVEHVFLTDNDSVDHENTAARLNEEFPGTFLTLRLEKTPRAQMKTYAWCAAHQRSQYNWIAFFDLDEYLVLTDPKTARQPDLKGFLNAYRYESGLSVNWVMVGPSGHKSRVATGGVLRDYTQCVPEPDRHIKTIANTWFLSGMTFHPHNFEFRGGGTSVNANFQQIRSTWFQVPRSFLPAGEKAWTTGLCDGAVARGDVGDDFYSHCFQAPAAITQLTTADKVALFHFATKSEEDFEAKVERGSGMSSRSKTWEYFLNVQERQSSDPLCGIPSKVWEDCCSGHHSDRTPSPQIVAASDRGAVAGYSTAGSPSGIVFINVMICTSVFLGLLVLRRRWWSYSRAHVWGK